MDNDIKHLYAIIRKPQEGKTFICLKNISMNNDNIHIIVTMNTIKSNNQFFERAFERFGNKICILNSKGSSNNEYNQTNNIYDILKYIKKKDCNIIICCAHPKRFRQSISDLIEEIDDSRRINKFISIHIDEAHAYVPSYSDDITSINSQEIIDRIYMYSASPFKIWVPKNSRGNDIFKNIYVIDIAKQFEIMKSDKYFGVKDCEHHIIDCSKAELISDEIPKDLIENWIEKEKEREKLLLKNKFYFNRFPFSLGNEIKLLSNTKYILEKMNGNEIKNNEFSYNFVPAYVRKVTHYSIMEIILSLYDNAMVILINGDGSRIFYIEDNSYIMENMIEENEPSKQIQRYIEKYQNRPFFITGFTCVGMSVTFINENIGNFDNVIFNHEHYFNQPEILYQLCRFLFNYIVWSNTDNIKKTKLFVSSKETLQICLDYENQIDKIDNELSGAVLTQDQVMGNIKIKRKKIPKEKKFALLDKYIKHFNVTTFNVENGNDEEIFNKVMKYCADFKFSGNTSKISTRSIPKKNKDGFYECSLTSKKTVLFDPSGLKNKLKNRYNKTDLFFITKNSRKYFRIFVAYHDESDKTDYVWYVRTMELEENEEVRKILDGLTK